MVLLISLDSVVMQETMISLLCDKASPGLIPFVCSMSIGLGIIAP